MLAGVPPGKAVAGWMGKSSRAGRMTGPRVVRTAQEVLWRDMSEKAWTKWVVSTAADFGWERYHPTLSVYSPRGWPDEALCRPPRLILAELKTMTGRVSPDQKKWLALLEQCPGVEVYLWRPCHQDEVIRVLAPEGRTIHY